MFLRILGCAIMAVALCAVGLEAGGGARKDKSPDGLIEPKKGPNTDNKAVTDKKATDRKTQTDKKTDTKETKTAKGVSGKLKNVNQAKGTLTVSPETGADRTFSVTEDTKFLGPRGGDRGMGKEGLNDETLMKGADVRVVPAADGKNAAEVYLPVRKGGGKKRPEKK
jgi:hypothetical protein